jgi:hypothetical protein
MTPFDPALAMTDVALLSSSAPFSVPSSIPSRTCLTMVFTVERTCRLRLRRFRLCLCRFMPDAILPKCASDKNRVPELMER